MWEDILNIVISNGIFATLFVFLLAYLLKDSSRREKKYTDTISLLNRHLNSVEDIEEKIDSMQSDLEITGKEVVEVKTDIKKLDEKVDLTNKSINVIDGNLKEHSGMIRKVSTDVKRVTADVKKVSLEVKDVKEDVKEIKKLVG